MKLDERRTTRYLDDPDARTQLEQLLLGKMPPPLDAVVHLNTYCNHRCDFCSNDLLVGDGKRLDMDAGHAASLFEELGIMGVKRLILSGGGEPLNHPDRKPLLETLDRQPYQRFLYSNLDVEIDDVFPLLLRFSGVSVNVNVTEPSIYRETRGARADIDRVKRNVLELAKTVPVTATVIVRDNTVGYLERTVDDLRSWGVTGIAVSPAFAMAYKDNILVSDVTLRTMERLKAKGLAGVRLLEPERPAARSDEGKTYCRSHQFTVTVGADRRLYPCCSVSYDPSSVLADLHDYRSFSEAWESRRDWNDAKCERCWLAPVNETLYRLGQ